MAGSAGFFGKLPGAGDFVQRRLPAAFVETWDARFEQAVAESRNALGADWQDAYRTSPSWRFVMAPRICGASAWAGVMGPGADRVGRCFPMVIAAELSPDFSACGEALSHGAWFDDAATLLTEAQVDPRGGVEGFDGRVAALTGLASAALPDPRDLLDRTDWKTATHWRLPLPSPTVFSSKYLTILWSRLAAGNWCLWWTEGGGRVPPSILVTAGLPHPQAYVGFLDAAKAGGGWQKLGNFASAPAPRLPSAPPAPAPVMERSAPVSPAASPPLDSDITQPVRVIPRIASGSASAGDLSDLLAPSPAVEIVESPPEVTVLEVAAPETPVPQQGPFAAVLKRDDCALTVVAGDSSEHDQQQRLSATVMASVRAMPLAEFTEGLHGLRARLLALHMQLRSRSDDLVNATLPADCAVAAARISGGQATVLRIGAASAWRWRRGQLQPLFVGGLAPAAIAGGDDLDDLLFSPAPHAAGGLGSQGVPLCDDGQCSLQPGDRLLLAATRRLAQLSPDVLLRGLAMPSRDEAVARIAAAAGLGPNVRAWPIAVIEVRS